MNTKDIIKDLKNLEDLFHTSNLIENIELVSNKNKRVIGQFKVEFLENIWIDKFNCLRSKTYAFKCGKIAKTN